MISLEQVNLLETRVAKAIEYVERTSGENAALRVKLGSYQKRIDELEVLIARFKEDQARIEDGILAALDRLNQFEDAIEKSLGGKTGLMASASAVQSEAKAKPAADSYASAGSDASKESVAPSGDDVPSEDAGGMSFEIPEEESAEDDIADPLEELSLNEEDDKPPMDGELDIF
ncbi:MAG: cell division protein ZapB [Treponema sp.]|jgi:chromosome segregation ATPase|nr:cell division protein ZapB [Treponema sp.]